MTPLGDIASISTGFPFRKKVETEDGGDIALLQIKDINGTEGVSGTGAVMLRGSSDKYEKYLLQQGDLLFQSRGSRHPVAVVGSSVRGIAAAGLYVIRPDTGRIRSDYLAWWLNHPNAQSKLTSDVARGSYIPFVSKRDLAVFLVPVPPNQIQERIAEVERLRVAEHALIDQLIELRGQVVATLTLAAAKNQRKIRND